MDYNTIMPQRPRDPNIRAFQVVQEATGQRPRLQPDNSHARTVRASKGGRGRAARLTPAERSAIARRAAEARWGIRAIGSTGARDESDE